MFHQTASVSLNWKFPFELAYQLALWAIGWSLFLVVSLFVLALTQSAVVAIFRILKGNKFVFPKVKPNVERTLRSVPDSK